MPNVEPDWKIRGAWIRLKPVESGSIFNESRSATQSGVNTVKNKEKEEIWTRKRKTLLCAGHERKFCNMKATGLRIRHGQAASGAWAAGNLSARRDR
jgi:hypothetical protein